MPLTQESPAKQPPSSLWLWGFWICVAIATAAFVLSLYTPYPIERVFRVASGVLFIVGGFHNGRVVAYKCLTRSPYSTFAPDALTTQRQIGWSAIVLGLVFVGSAFVGL
ncbi:MAG: hypothetical protein ACKVP2_14365 [Burkholderiales bacterium]